MADQSDSFSSDTGSCPSAAADRAAAVTQAGGGGSAVSSLSAAISGDEAKNDDDENLARRLQTLDQLTSVFGFTLEMAEAAVDAVGFHDINLCYNYILDNADDMGGAQDKGGPVTPIDSCPHIQNHVKLSLDQLPFQPHATTCQRVTLTTTTKATGASAAGRFKSDLQDDGTCPGTENWLCLECGTIRCSRYVNGHGLVHWEQTKAAAVAAAQEASSSTSTEEDKHGHCVAVSLADLSVWCYVCNAYLRHPSLSAITQKLEVLKFADDDTPTITLQHSPM
jgi:uncharacterized UBP type Zn finger protein